MGITISDAHLSIFNSILDKEALLFIDLESPYNFQEDRRLANSDHLLRRKNKKGEKYDVMIEV